MATYTLISSVTVGSGGPSTIDFTSIPATYTDLVLKLSARSSNATGDLKINFNSISTGYTRLVLQGISNGTTSSSSASDSWIGLVASSGDPANTFASTEIYIPNYAGSAYKSFSVDNVMESNSTAVYLNLLARLWSNTAAITSISISALSGTVTFAQYTTAYLYGISKA
jgi:hypothetical protein